MPDLVVGPLLRHVGPTHATVWVETDGPCEVEVAGCRAATFTVAGHHYALVVVDGLAPGAVVEYDVRLDGQVRWPVPGNRFPPSRIRTPAADGAGPVRVSFGSCRYATPRALVDRSYGADALDALALRLAAAADGDDPEPVRPDLLLLLGDQVYADETTPQVRRRILERRGGESEPRGEVADFEEYTWLYHQSWLDEEVRWLLSTVPTAMIFDDHDVHDDWNTSAAWRQTAAAQPWWGERIVAALASYWVYQHLGNLSPAELAADPTWQAIGALPPGADAEPVLRALALQSDAAAAGRPGYRWSFRRDLGRVRLVVLDSRCGRVLHGDRRSMLGDQDWDWLEDQLTLDPADGVEHVLVGSSLPWLLAPALHAVEAWDERLAASSGRRRAALGERLRQAGDLEHWAAFTESFDRLGDLLGGLSRGERGPAPVSVAVLSGDVHHSYVCRARWAGPQRAPVHQVTCSPLHNRIPGSMRAGFRLSWNRLTTVLARGLLGGLGRVPRPSVDWDLVAGPFFGNMLATLDLDGPRAGLVVEATTGTRTPTFEVLVARDLTGSGWRPEPTGRTVEGCPP